MNSIELTISEVRTLIGESIKIRRKFDEVIELFLQRFKGQDCLNSDSAEDEVSMEFKESFFKLMEAKNMISEATGLANEFCRSLEFVKAQEVNYTDSGQIVRTERIHEFLMDNISIGGESQWNMLFRVPPKDIPSMICYMNGMVFYRVSVEGISRAYHEKCEDSDNFDSNDFFPENCWVEMNVFALVSDNNEIIKIVK